MCVHYRIFISSTQCSYYIYINVPYREDFHHFLKVTGGISLPCTVKQFSISVKLVLIESNVSVSACKSFLK
jgi:hypothetical protein